MRHIIQNLPWQKWPILAFYISLFTFFMLIPAEGQSWLRYNYTELQNQQSWRIITGHFIHTNWYHYVLNTGAFIALWALHGKFYQGRKLFSFIIMNACLITAYIYFFTDIGVYSGFSGILHGLIVWGAIQDIQHKDKTGYLLLLGVFAKVIYEMLYGASAATASMIQADVAVEAHLAGVLAALLYMFGELVKAKQLEMNNNQD
ncbi:membrane protein, Rhomboid family [Catenovulum agarivorans DS-2]|uniref:Membrane protein, Rhomboid family n=1 Tax=Catenovulum agarivorans DS-2 TaxID=1328313 RepID=W7QUW8_9ALTE|nr:rhombosortase [Catenovulum agarivorans]EWH09080.1 membrane protein, Rhomboid family [Catenovulum agarivorans DS-2]